MSKALERCPACGAPCEAYHPASEDDYEWWGFACEAEVIREDNGKLYAEHDCRAALSNALSRLNDAPDQS